jgi:hypothetical protein
MRTGSRRDRTRARSRDFVAIRDTGSCSSRMEF